LAKDANRTAAASGDCDQPIAAYRAGQVVISVSRPTNGVGTANHCGGCLAIDHDHHGVTGAARRDTVSTAPPP
jgi:hypothetical protein